MIAALIAILLLGGGVENAVLDYVGFMRSSVDGVVVDEERRADVLATIQEMKKLTGYLLIAFFVGDKLTKFQAAFASLMFLGLYGSYQISIWGQLSRMAHFNAELSSLGSSIPTDKIYPHFSPLLSLLLAAGSLYFMWSVRHPNTE